jgi:transposase-like protein
MLSELIDFDTFSSRFATEEACEDALYKLRWPNGFHCPRCNGSRVYPIRTRKLYQCAKCNYQASLTAGTVFEHSRTPLTKWFIAIYMMARASSISAIALQKVLKVTYKTAWTMLMKLRCAMGRKEEATVLHGVVKMDTVVYGKKIKSSLNNCGVGEHPVMLCVSTSDNSMPEQIKIKCVPNKYLTPERYVMRTAAYRYFQSKYVGSDSSVEVFSLPRRRYFLELAGIVRQAEKWVYSTFIAIGGKHLQKYLDEYCFRYNAEAAYRPMMSDRHYKMIRYPTRFGYPRAVHWWSRQSATHSADTASLSLFESILQVAVSNVATTYKAIIHHRRTEGSWFRFPTAS